MKRFSIPPREERERHSHTMSAYWLFNIKISDCHQKHEDVIKRKPGKLTEFLNGLADLIRKEHDKKGYR